MQRNKFSAIIGAAVMLVMVNVALVSGASAQAHAYQFKVLYSFTNQSEGWALHGGLVSDATGNLYGTTSFSAEHGCGAAFRLTPNSDGIWTLSVLYAFAGGQDGCSPNGPLVFDAAGNLYGTTPFGGTDVGDEFGTVFKLTPSSDGTWTESVLYRFAGGAEGYGPQAGLALDAAGNLYGTTYEGGTVFELTPNSDGTWTHKVIHYLTDGSSLAALTIDAASNLYGTTYEGGANGQGGVFQMTQNSDGTWAFHMIRQFGGKDGGGSQATLVFDAAGNLYGAASGGGIYEAGTAFRLKPNPGGAWSEYVLHHFTGGKDGATPVAGLTVDAAGSLYGTTFWGGSYGHGTVFKLKPNPGGGWTECVLHQFTDGKDGGGPSGLLILDAAGNLYGVTYGGGSSGVGVAFEITSATTR